MPSNVITPAEYRKLLTDRAPKGKRIYALGRLKVGTMNGLESRYASHLELRKLAGEVAWWKFEGIKLRLADLTFLTMDFAVMLADGTMELHDTKGGPIEEDAAAKLKIAAEQFPFRFFVVRERRKREGGGFVLKDVSGGL
jgi:hypothetical protein